MKTLAFVIDVVVLCVLVFAMVALLGDTFTKGGIVIKALLMGAVGAVYGLLRPLYRKRLVPEDYEDSDK